MIKKYFSLIYSLLVVIAIAVASLVYFFVAADRVELEDVILQDSENGTESVNPGEGMVPAGPPTPLVPTEGPAV